MSAMKIKLLVLSVLLAGLAIMVINVGVDVIFPEQKLEKTVYPVPAIEPPAEAAPETAAEAAETVETAAASVAEPEAAAAPEPEPEVEKAEPMAPAATEETPKPTPPSVAVETAEPVVAAVTPEAAVVETPKPAAETKAGETAEPVVAAVTPETAAEKAEPVSPLAALLARADPERGKKVAKKCVACHTVNRGGKKKLGPNLWGVVGAKQAASEGFKYSRAFAGLDGAWGYAELDAFLASPKTYAPGTKMGFPGVKKPADRADLIAYLRTLADTSPPLPRTE